MAPRSSSAPGPRATPCPSGRDSSASADRVRFEPYLEDRDAARRRLRPGSLCRAPRPVRDLRPRRPGGGRVRRPRRHRHQTPSARAARRVRRDVRGRRRRSRCERDRARPPAPSGPRPGRSARGATTGTSPSRRARRPARGSWHAMTGPLAVARCTMWTPRSFARASLRDPGLACPTAASTASTLLVIPAADLHPVGERCRPSLPGSGAGSRTATPSPSTG